VGVQKTNYQTKKQGRTTEEKAKSYALENKDALALWQYISEDTAKIKDKGWAIAS
jgi:hypothetical protein